MSNAFDQPLQVRFEPSRILLLAFLTLYVLATLCWLAAPVSWPTRLGLYCLLAGHFVYLYRLHVAASSRVAIRILAWDSVRGWRIHRRDGVWLDAEILWPAYVSYRLVAVRFRVGRFGRRRLVVVPDRLGDNDFRRLRVRLLQCAHAHRD